MSLPNSTFGHWNYTGITVKITKEIGVDIEMETQINVAVTTDDYDIEVVDTIIDVEVEQE